MALTAFSEEVWKNWEKSGRSEFMKACKHLLKDETKSPLFSKTGVPSAFNGYLYNLIIRGIQGQVKKEGVIATLSELVAQHNDVSGLICDVLNILDAETLCDSSTEARNNFCFIVRESEKFLSDKLLKERLEIDTLQEVGILKNKNFYTRFIKVKTKLYYKQRKFNLFREESEGYSKLIVELNQDVSDNAVNILEVIKSLIGCFNLDPNRVIDIILESFENRPDRDEYFIPLIRSYMNDPKIICEVLGSKFSFYQSSLEQTTPRSLYTVAALLLQHGIIPLDDIYCWLTPDDRTMQREADKEMRDAREYVRKLQIISIKDKDKEEPVEERDNAQEKYAGNQKLGLCEALLDVGDWNSALLVIRRLPEHLAVDQQPVALAICRLLHGIVEPVYRRHCALAPRVQGRAAAAAVVGGRLAPQPAQTFLDLREHAVPMLVVLGPALRYDPVLMYKVIRLAKAALGSLGDLSRLARKEDTLYYDVLTLLDATVLPSLSYMDCNCCIAEEVWNVLKLYPYQCRYCLYSRWKNDTYQQHAKLLVKRGDAQKQIKNIMKRVSKETIKPVGRLIGKLTHCSPGFLFDYVLLQIQIYDNLIHPVVDSLKYLTSLSYDVLGYCLVESLTQGDRNRVKHDGTSISLWLQSLASFCGAIFKKYNIELTGLLQYVANQLKAQKSLDLLILKEIVQKMAGIEAAEELTDEQLDAMAGGELLKAEAGYFSQVRNTKKSSSRLKEAMNEQNLAVALCLLIAQQKYCVVYRETENSHLKLVGKLYDQCQDTLVQFGNFLNSTLSVDEYVNKLPTIQSMLQDYHIHSDVAFFLARTMFNHAINIKYDQLRKLDPNCKKLSTSVKQQKYYEAVKEIMAPIVESVIPLHSVKVWEDISPQFLVTFWSLNMYDLYVPADSYQREVSKLRQLSLQAMDSKDITVSKGKKEQERYISMMEKLQDEKKKQHEHVEKVLYRLKQEKDSWFLSRSVKSAKNETITQFLQLCLFPRCVFTAIDAAYCAKFVHTIHMLKTANFATLLCYDRLFCDITYSVTSCTENEANRYGRFLCAMLGTVMRWHSDKAIYDQECANYPGFVTKYRVSNQFTENCDHVGYENYRHVCHKWHYKITKAMMICLDSKDYVQIRNALIILIKIIPHFPVLNKLAQIIERRVEKVRDEEKNQRQDLYTLAISYAGQLKLRAGHMIKESDFHQVLDKPKSSGEQLTETEADTPKPAGTDHKDKERQPADGAKDAPPPKDAKDRAEKKACRAQADTFVKVKHQSPQSPSYKDQSKDRADKEKTPLHKDELKEKHSKKEKDKEEKREDTADKDRDREREKRKERKEEKLLKEDRQYREERYVEIIVPKDDGRYSGDRIQSDRYYSSSDRSVHYYDDRDSMPLSNSNNSSNLRRSQEPTEADRDVKRRKLEGPSSKSSKHEERKLQHQLDQFLLEKSEKKERGSKTKDKRDKATDEDKELRKERKMGRKRDRAEEALLQEQKRRRDEEKAMKMLHANGEMLEPSVHIREKHHHSRDKSPYPRERERSHDRAEMRDKHRRSSEGKRR